jgi:hypothetical protein
MVEVVSTVAARSFFAVVERCDDERFDALSAGAAGWWIASIQFNEGDERGVVSCAIADDLAFALFDAFTGRDPHDPPADPTDLVDLLGEFSNMVGGTWLTRLANHQGFSLGSPQVQRVASLSRRRDADPRVLLSLNDRPLAVEVRIAAHGDSASPVGA